MSVVELQYSGIICTSKVNNVAGDIFDGPITSDDGYTGEIR